MSKHKAPKGPRGATPAGPGSSRGGAGQVRAESSQALAPLPVVETAGSSGPSSLAKWDANGFWDTLAAFATEKQIPPGDAKSLDVLYHRLVLKYNGQGWYDVVPMVAELPEFQRAQQKHSEPS